MLLRKLLLAAALMAPLASMPSAVSAQEHGRARAVVASHRAAEGHGWEHGRHKGRPTTLPRGIANGAGGSTLPPGIHRTRPQPEPDVQPEPQPEPEPEQPPADCGGVPATQNGVPGVLDTCTGIFTPLF